MAKRKATPKAEHTPRRMPDEAPPATQFAYEMASDPRFGGRRWKDVEAGLRAEYPGWLTRHVPDGGSAASWDLVKDAVRAAWDAALDVERVEVDPWTGQWDERAPAYRSMWERRFGASGARWEDHEVGYRYADAMAMDPRYLGRPWDDIAPGLETAFPAWAASHGYRIVEGENMWERLRETIKHGWDHLKHRHSA